MAKPWEKYQAAPKSGPWSKYQQAAAEPAEPAKPKERPGFRGSFMEAAKTLGLADEAAEFAANPTAENRKKLLAAGESKFESVGGFGKGENWEAFKELLGGSFGQMVAPVAAGVAGSVATPLVGVGAGYATAMSQYNAQYLLGQAQEQEQDIAEGRAPREISASKALVAAAGSAGLDYVQFKFFRKALELFPFAKNLVLPEKELREQAANRLIEAARNGTLKSTGAGTVVGAVKGVTFEVPQEMAQTALERWQAGLSLTDEEAQEEFKQAAIGAAVLGPLMGGVSGARGARAERKQAKELEESDFQKTVEERFGGADVVETGIPADALAEFTKPVPLVEQPPKVKAEDAPIEVRQEPLNLSPKDVQDEILKMETSQQRRADYLNDLDKLKSDVESIGGDYESGLQQIVEKFDNTATRLDVFRKHLASLSVAPEETPVTPVAPISQSAEAQQALSITPPVDTTMPPADMTAPPPVAPTPPTTTVAPSVPDVTAPPEPITTTTPEAVAATPEVTTPMMPIPQRAAAQQALPMDVPSTVEDPLYLKAVDAVIKSGTPTVSTIQNALQIGYKPASMMLRKMEIEGIVSAPDKDSRRKIMMDEAVTPEVKKPKAILIHGGRDFEGPVDFSQLGTGEPGAIRPLGNGLYGYVIYPDNVNEIEKAVETARDLYAKKFGGDKPTIHVFNVDTTADVKQERLPIGLTEMAVLEPENLQRVGKFTADTPPAKIRNTIINNLGDAGGIPSSAEEVGTAPVGGSLELPLQREAAAGPAVVGPELGGMGDIGDVTQEPAAGAQGVPPALETVRPSVPAQVIPEVPVLPENATDAEVKAYYEAVRARDVAMGVKPPPPRKKKRVKLQESSDLQGKDLTDLGGSLAKAIKNLPPLSRDVYNKVRAILNSKDISDNLRSGIYMTLSMPQQAQLFVNELPSLRGLVNAISARASAFKTRREEIDRNIRRWQRMMKPHDAKVDLFYEIANESTRLQVDFKTDVNDPLTIKFNALPADLKKVYWEMLSSYKKLSDEYLDLVTKNVSKSLASQFKAEMAAKRLKVYFPLYREGDYWLRYQDAKNDTVVRAFNSSRDRETAIKEAGKVGGTGFQEFTRIEDTYEAGQVGPFFDRVYQELSSRGLSQEVGNALYKLYLDQIPASSVRQQFQKREGYKGFETDMMKVYATVGTRMANQLNNLEYLPEIDSAYAGVIEDAKKDAAQSKSTAIKSLMKSLEGQMEFVRNPTNAWISNKLASFSYYWYIIGNVSTAFINLSQVPAVVYPVLNGIFPGKAGDALVAAKNQYFKGGWDNDIEGEKRAISDWTFGVGLPKGSPLARLYEIGVQQGAIRRSSGYDVVQGRQEKYGQGDYVGTMAKLEQLAGWKFQNSERFNREVTLIAAFNLEMQRNGGNATAAANFAIDIVNETHGTTLNELSPRVFQTDFGKVAFIFKNFAQTMLYLQYKLIREAFKGESRTVKMIAARQLAGIYGMAYLFSGVMGMPFVGGATAIAGLLEDWFGDDDDPIDPEEFIRQSIKSLFYKGPLSQILQVDIASRTGFNNLLWREDDRRVEEIGPVLFAVEQIFGASYSAGMGVYRSFNDFAEGHTWRGVESLLPAALRNGMKAFRYAEKGAKTRDGDVIVEDVNAYNTFMQLLGFAPLEVAEKSAAAGKIVSMKDRLDKRKKSIYNKFYMAYTAGDKEGIADAEAAREKFNNSKSVIAQNMQISNADVRKSISQRKRASAQSVYGIYVPLKRQAGLEAYKPEGYDDET